MPAQASEQKVSLLESLWRRGWWALSARDGLEIDGIEAGGGWCVLSLSMQRPQAE
jgi:hypothetical protein